MYFIGSRLLDLYIPCLIMIILNGKGVVANSNYYTLVGKDEGVMDTHMTDTLEASAVGCAVTCSLQRGCTAFTWSAGLQCLTYMVVQDTKPSSGTNRYSLDVTKSSSQAQAAVVESCSVPSIKAVSCEGGTKPINIVSALNLGDSNVLLIGDDRVGYGCPYANLGLQGAANCSSLGGALTFLSLTGATPDAALSLLYNDFSLNRYLIFQDDMVHCYQPTPLELPQVKVHCTSAVLPAAPAKITDVFGQGLPGYLDAAMSATWSDVVTKKVYFWKGAKMYVGHFDQGSHQVTEGEPADLVGTSMCGVTAGISGNTQDTYILFRGSYVFDHSGKQLARLCI